MESLRFAHLIRRNWVLTLAIVATTLAAMALFAVRTPTTYQGAASYALAFPERPPTAADAAADPKLSGLVVSNPLLNYDSKGTVTEVLAARLLSDDVKKEVAERGGTGDYTADTHPTASAGSGSLVLDLVAKGATESEARTTAEVLGSVAKEQLAALQGPAAATTYQVRLLDLQTTIPVTPQPLSKIRVLIGLGAAGLIALLTALSLAEVVRQQRGTRTQQVRTVQTSAGATSADVSTPGDATANDATPRRSPSTADRMEPTRDLPGPAGARPATATGRTR